MIGVDWSSFTNVSDPGVWSPTLRRVLAFNTCLWGGIFNFIIPLFRQTPTRYNDRPFRGPNAKQLLDGLVEAFEPDFLVEAEPGLASSTSFPADRVIGLDDIFRRDEYRRGGYGLSLFDVCAAMYCNAPQSLPPTFSR
jgi:hypothetical protein